MRATASDHDTGEHNHARGDASDNDSPPVSRPKTLYARVFKRVFDAVGAAALLVLLSPVLLLTAVAVAAFMGFPILFRDRRAGLNGQPFTLLKFRSMRNASGHDGRQLPDAQRLTSFGTLLRRTSLDELPQLFCVIAGSMSLVGPRPLPERYLPRYSARQASRLFVRPGLTGWAQTHGRNAVDWEKRLALDADYVAMLGRSGGLLIDLRIVASTVGQVLLQALTGRGVSAPGQATMQEFLGDARRDAKGKTAT
jgi:sugar transferase EpsL